MESIIDKIEKIIKNFKKQEIGDTENPQYSLN